MSLVTTRESVDRAVQDLEEAVARAAPIIEASVSRVEARASDGRWSVAVAVGDDLAFRPCFTSWLDAHEFRTAAFEIVAAAS